MLLTPLALKNLTFSVRYMEVVEGLLHERGASLSVLLNALGLTETQLRDPQQTIDGQQYRRGLASALPHCLPGQALSQQYLNHVPLTILGPLATLILASDTLGDALLASERYVGVLLPSHTMRVEVLRDEVHVIISRLSDFCEVDDLLTEIVLGLFLQVQRFMAEPLRQFELHFRHPSGPQAFATADPMVSAVHFSAPVDRVVFPRKLLAVRTVTGSRVLHAKLSHTLDQMARTNGPPQALTQQLRRVIRDRLLTGQSLQGDALAETLQLSRRTLDRRLHMEGITLATLTFDARLTLADTLLLTTSLPLAKIARRTGFTELSNFTRAFRRRFGCTPSERRQG
jgi:AraC-like DNA-binding protein